MDLENISEYLSPIERQVLLKIEEETSAKGVAEKGIDETTVLRATNYLKAKGLVETEEEEETLVELGILGVNYVKKELPERALLNKLSNTDKIPINEVKNVCNLNENEAKVAIGSLKSKALIDIEEGKIKRKASDEEISKLFLEEKLINSLPRKVDSLEAHEKLALEKLKKRKEIIEIVKQKRRVIRLTDEGKKAKEKGLLDNMIEQVTPKLIKSMGWKGKRFRKYDVNAPVPRFFTGKRHFVNQATDYAKSIWLEMGFKEMTGDMTMTGLYNFDALFTAQDHPVREMQDTFFLKGVKGELPSDKKLINEIKKAHEGGCDNSLGWAQSWDEEEAKKVLLRTHTTPLSIKTMIRITEKNEFPAKYFALGKCFRNETVDWSHSFEFNQTEGIVVDENANFRQLLGYLKQFYRKMGYDKIRVRPAYFPYTEPSLEVEVYHPKRKKWMELGGAGMFRPEVTIPIFKRHIPVLAWGQGMERIIMEFFKIEDLREMNSNDINKLREMKVWSK